jgi:hypothetical protein
VVCHQVTLEHRELFTTVETDDVTRHDRAFHRNCWHGLRSLSSYLIGGEERGIDSLNQPWKLIWLYRIALDVCGDDLTRKVQEFMAFSHRFTPRSSLLEIVYDFASTLTRAAIVRLSRMNMDQG